MPIGALLGGVIAEVAGPAAVFIVAGVMTLAMVLLKPLISEVAIREAELEGLADAPHRRFDERPAGGCVRATPRVLAGPDRSTGWKSLERTTPCGSTPRCTASHVPSVDPGGIRGPKRRAGPRMNRQ